MMKGIALLALVSVATAFPAAIFEQSDPEVFKRAIEILKRQSGADSATAVFEPVNTFNAQAQYVDVSEGSGHEYQAPGEGDLRGPCPGLNAFANHNFLPHNGYATIQQFIQATEDVVGMGPQLALFLATFGAIVDGSGTAWSIGGTPSIGATGGNGISGSHNKYEGDSSPTRPDLYQAGNDYMTVASQFQQMLDASPGNSITIDSLTSFRAQRFATQMNSNAYWFNGPFTGVLVQPAAYTFIFRFMANHSETQPTGYLDYDVARSWFGISSDGQAMQGQEQIPANWYKRAIEYPYEVEYFLADVAAAAALHPQFLDVGGNLGKAGDYAGVNIANLTGGVYNSQDLLKGNNFACFAFQFAAQVKADSVLGTVSALAGNVVNNIIGKLGCPQLQKIDDEQLMQFPGYARSPAA